LHEKALIAPYIGLEPNIAFLTETESCLYGTRTEFSIQLVYFLDLRYKIGERLKVLRLGRQVLGGLPAKGHGVYSHLDKCDTELLSP